MENGLIKMAVDWALTRLGERNTWVTWIALLAAHFGGVVNPAFEPLVVNLALALIAVVGYAVKGKPIIEGKK